MCAPLGKGACRTPSAQRGSRGRKRSLTRQQGRGRVPHARFLPPHRSPPTNPGARGGNGGAPGPITAQRPTNARPMIVQSSRGKRLSQDIMGSVVLRCPGCPLRGAEPPGRCSPAARARVGRRQVLKPHCAARGRRAKGRAARASRQRRDGPIDELDPFSSKSLIYPEHRSSKLGNSGGKLSKNLEDVVERIDKFSTLGRGQQ